MNILLDTSTFIWVVANPKRLSKTAKDICLNEENTLYFSVISAWEIQIKYLLRKLPLPEVPEKIIQSQISKHRIEVLPLELDHIFQLSTLPSIHKDPFDRMLVCQAKARRMNILTPDPQIRRYNVKTIW